ncbi:helix-turn-helix domain-containing protein [Arabiibacter massiliensis]|uniref:helix-turn-helix domain-containing protein n=1 Tax=Arabiibacter massiliensis TaxID=1870985 RepID=UPI001E650C74|nr:helix-turn-helix transcriptional regulator [Arabiibacter massiliensis]
MELGRGHTGVDEGNLDRHRCAPILAENVKRLRKEAKINKKRFALMVGIGRPFLNKIEDGTANPRLDVIVRIADALEKRPEELLVRQDEQRPKPLAESRSPEARHARLF